MVQRGELILVWGAGGHGCVVAEVARACGHDVAGFADRDPAKLGTEVVSAGAVVLVSEVDLLSAIERDDELPARATAVAYGIGDNHARRAARLRAMAAETPTLVHPRATVARSVRIGKATVVLPGAVVNPGAHVGYGVILNTACVVEHDCVLADDVHVSPGAVLGGGTCVGVGAWIGANATVRHGVSVGAWAVVGAGAVLLRDVPDGVTVVGNPARELKEAI